MQYVHGEMHGVIFIDAACALVLAVCKLLLPVRAEAHEPLSYFEISMTSCRYGALKLGMHYFREGGRGDISVSAPQLPSSACEPCLTYSFRKVVSFPALQLQDSECTMVFVCFAKRLVVNL